MKTVVILIVDDDKNVCDYLKKLLSSLDCTIEVAYSLGEGLKLMQRLTPTPSFVFLDLHFPGSDAQDTLESVGRFYAINPKASIIVITGLIDEKIQQMANALGAAFRQKPTLRSQEDVWKSLEEAIELGKKHGVEPYEVTTQVLSKISELRNIKGLPPQHEIVI